MNKINFLIIILIQILSINFLFALNETDYNYQLIESKLQFQQELQIIVELYPNKEKLKYNTYPDFFNLFSNLEPKKVIIPNNGYFYEHTEIEKLHNRTINKLNISISEISQSKMSPFFSLTINSTTFPRLLEIEEIESIRINDRLKLSLDSALPGIGLDIVHAQEFQGEGQVIAIIDTGVNKNHEFFGGRVVSEACYSNDYCPGGPAIKQSTANNSAIDCTGTTGCGHGTHVAGIAAGDNGVLKGGAPKADIIAIKVFSIDSPEVSASVTDITLGLERVYELSSTYNIAAVGMSLGGSKFNSNCDSYYPPMTNAIDALKSKGIAVFVASGNDGYTDGVGFPSCISSAISVGASDDTNNPAGFSNSGNPLNIYMPGLSITSSTGLTNGYSTWQGTSMATPLAVGGWATLKSANPRASYNEIYDLMISEGTSVTKGAITRPKTNFNLVVDKIAVPQFQGGTPTINISITEEISQQILYNPLKPSSGQYQNTSEILENFNIGGGEIIISNTHKNESLGDLRVEISQLGNAYNFTHLSGRQGFVNQYDSFFIYLEIPELGAGQNVTFHYNLNSSNIKPPIDLTTSFQKDKILPGYELEIKDTITNQLDYLTLNSETCIYNIQVNQKSLVASIGIDKYNFTFVNNSISGEDSINVDIQDNQTMLWNVSSSQCLYNTNSTSIQYNINIPSGINESNNYLLTNSSISYKFNSTASEIRISRVLATVNLDSQFNKKVIEELNTDNVTWQITSQVNNPTDIAVNLKEVSLWVSQRNGTGTGFTNPSLIDTDINSGAQLDKTYYLHYLLNESIKEYSNLADEWKFNYSFSSSPIVWMNLKNDLIENDVQVVKSPMTGGDNFIYLKEIYITSNYYIQISKNITKINNTNYNVKINVLNLGQSKTIPNQYVVIYNFIPNEFSLTSPFIYSQSEWYTTDNTNTTLSDPTYNGTMYQYALLPNLNIYNTSLDKFGSAINVNNSWSVEYNLSGIGIFKFDDLFLTGVDPLFVDKIGATKAIDIKQNNFKSSNQKIFSFETISIITSIIVIGLIMLF